MGLSVMRRRCYVGATLLRVAVVCCVLSAEPLRLLFQNMVVHTSDCSMLFLQNVCSGNVHVVAATCDRFSSFCGLFVFLRQRRAATNQRQYPSPTATDVITDLPHFVRVSTPCLLSFTPTTVQTDIAHLLALHFQTPTDRYRSLNHVLERKRGRPLLQQRLDARRRTSSSVHRTTPTLAVSIFERVVHPLGLASCSVVSVLYTLQSNLLVFL